MKELLNDITSGRPTFDAFVEAFVGDVPLLDELSNTPQDPVWHAEGNVAVHTAMVLEALFDDLDRLGIDGDERLGYALGAFFHDIAKTITTRERVQDGQTRIISPRHAEVGRSYLAYRSLAWPISAEVRAQMLAIVGHHHDHRRLYQDDSPVGRWKRLAELVSLEHLYVFGRADLLGRICADQKAQLEIVDLFRVQAEEYKVFRDRDPWRAWREHLENAWSDESELFRRAALSSTLEDARRGQIHAPEEGVARAFRYKDGFSHLVVMCGPSGAGKSTWIEQNVPGYQVISLDAIREELTGDAADQSRNGEVRQISTGRLKAALAAHENVVWDASNLRKDFRRAPISIGKDYGALTTLVVLEADLASCRSRNQKRARQVPDFVIEKQFERAEFPFADEAHEVLFARI